MIYLNNLITVWGGEAAIVPVEPGEVPHHDVGEGEGGDLYLRMWLPNLIQVGNNASQARIRLFCYLYYFTDSNYSYYFSSSVLERRVQEQPSCHLLPPV